jgi:uncharacterized protein (TIGR02118 family)
MEDDVIALKLTAMAAGLVFSTAVFAADAKITVLYAQPKNAEEFDKHYSEKHVPMLNAIKEIKKVEVSKPVAAPNGAAPYYQITEIYFDSPEALKTTTESPAWAAVRADAATFIVPGSSTVLISVIEPKH